MRFLCAATIAFCLWCALASIRDEQRRWEAYRIAHHCADAGVSWTTVERRPVLVGKVLIMQDQERREAGYRCDGGEWVWR